MVKLTRRKGFGSETNDVIDESGFGTLKNVNNISKWLYIA